MLNDSVKKRQNQLSGMGDCDQTFESQSSEEEEKLEDSFQLNLESVILLENKLYRVAQNIK
jgi:hypothetical protein